MIKACVFDVDGTLLDSLASLWYTNNNMLSQEGLMNLPMENYKYYAGDGARTLLARVLADTKIVDSEKAKHDPKNPDDFEYYFAEHMKCLNKDKDYEVKPYDGMVELLKDIKARGLKLGVLSNKPYEATQKLIPQYFGEGTFDKVMGLKDGMKKKPDPTGAFEIAEEFGVKTSEMMYFGDTNVDMQTGKNAGMYTVGVLWGFRTRKELEDNHADVIIEHPLDAIKLLNEMT